MKVLSCSPSTNSETTRKKRKPQSQSNFLSIVFLIGKPTLKAMKATINFEHMTLGIKFNNYYHRICLHDNGAHILLDFKASGNTYFSTPGAHNTSTYTGITSKPVYIRPEKNITPITPSKPASSSNQFDPKNLKKLHLQLKHGSHTAMREYLRAANYWRPEFDENISSLIEECGLKELLAYIQYVG